MVKTSLNVDTPPKISLERLKMKDEKIKDRTTRLVSSKDKEDLFFLKAYEQLESISPIFFRPTRPKGESDPYLSFTVLFKGEGVQG